MQWLKKPWALKNAKEIEEHRQRKNGIFFDAVDNT